MEARKVLEDQKGGAASAENPLAQMADLLKEDGDMVSVKKDEILPGLPLPTDVFVKLSNGKFVLIAKKGTKASLGELHVSQSQDVSNFFVRREDYQIAVDQNLKIAGILARRNDIPVPRRAAFVRTAADTVFKEMQHVGMNTKSFTHAKQTVMSVCTLVQARQDYFQLVSAMNELPGSIIKEAIAGAALSVLIGRELGWKNQAQLEKLALGAFLRDVGLKEVPQEILEKERASMTAEEREKWETHPFRGAEILQNIPDIPPEVIACALEHHENSIGQGFPRRIRDSKMNPFAKVVALADTFIHLTIATPHNPKVRSLDGAAQYIEYTMGCPFNKAVLVALKRALDLDAATTGGDPTQAA